MIYITSTCITILVRCRRDRMVVRLTTTCAVPITTKVVSLNPIHGEVYLVEHYVRKFVSDMSVVFSTNKTDRHDITEILLKVALSTKNPPHNTSK